MHNKCIINTVGGVLSDKRNIGNATPYFISVGPFKLPYFSHFSRLSSLVKLIFLYNIK